MRWALVCLCVCAVGGIELRCDPPSCSIAKSDYSKWQKFYIEGVNGRNTVEMTYSESYLYVNCHGWEALDSLGMPHFTSEFQASTVVLASCPLPTTRNASLVNALAAINVTLQPTNGETNLKILDFPSTQELTPHYFFGLKHLTNLTIKTSETTPKPSAGFFAEFQNLRSLELSRLQLPEGELYRLPNSLKSLELAGVSVDLLPNTISDAMSEALLALPNLLTLAVRGKSMILNSSHLLTKTYITKPPTNATSSLETLSLYFWDENHPKALKQCENLRILRISQAFGLLKLPERFVAACPRLEELEVIWAPMLGPLPTKLLEGATALKRLIIQKASFAPLPQGLLQGAPNLIELDLSQNMYITLPSGIFRGLPLRSLSLQGNELNTTAELVTLTSLVELDLSSNTIHDLCDDNGYSPLLNLTQLKKLDLSHNYVTRICRDWREKLIFLENLNLNSDSFKRLEFADFQHTRDASVKNSVVNLGEWVSGVSFTEDDYKNALTAPATGATLKFENEFKYENEVRINCNCTLYWLRRALDSASQAIKMEGFVCSNNRRFIDMTPEEVCPERVSTTEKLETKNN